MHKDEGLKFRENVSLITFRKGPSFLLVNLLSWPPDCWKFPQGGINQGEDLTTAAVREFIEELGNSKIEIVKVTDIIRKYTWEKPISIQGIEYVGQSQTFLIAKYTGNDEDFSIDTNEIRDYKWVAEDELEAHICKKTLDLEDYWQVVKKIIQENKENFER